MYNSGIVSLISEKKNIIVEDDEYGSKIHLSFLNYFPEEYKDTKIYYNRIRKYIALSYQLVNSKSIIINKDYEKFIIDKNYEGWELIQIKSNIPIIEESLTNNKFFFYWKNKKSKIVITHYRDEINKYTELNFNLFDIPKHLFSINLLNEYHVEKWNFDNIDEDEYENIFILGKINLNSLIASRDGNQQIVITFTNNIENTILYIYNNYIGKSIKMVIYPKYISDFYSTSYIKYNRNIEKFQINENINCELVNSLIKMRKIIDSEKQSKIILGRPIIVNQIDKIDNSIFELEYLKLYYTMYSLLDENGDYLVYNVTDYTYYNIYILYDIWNKRLIASLHTSNPKYNIKIGKRINIYNEHGEKIKPYNLEYVEHLNIDFNGNYNYLFTIDNYYFFCNAENSICAYKVNDKFTEILSEKNFGKKFTLKTTEIIYYVNTNNVKIPVSESNIIINSKINNIDFLYSTVHKLKKTIINWI